MVDDRAQELVHAVGARLLELIPPTRSRVLLYSELQDMALSLAIFLDEGNRVSYFEEDDPDEGRKLTDALFDLWYDIPPDERWAEIEMFIHEGNFDVTFNYQGDIDPKERDIDRRDRIVAKYFGEKPIFYPPLKRYDGLSFDL